MSRTTVSAALSALFLLAACAPNPYSDYYIRSQSSPTAVGQTVSEPSVVSCGQDSSELMYRVYSGKGYDPIGSAFFTHDRSILKDNASYIYAQATNVYADLATYSVCQSHTMHPDQPHATDIYEFRAIFWQKSHYSPLLGGECRALTDGEANEFKVNGILVTAIRNESPGFKGDVRVGDIILESDGRQMATLEIFRQAIASSIGRTVELKLFRNGDIIKTRVTLEANR